MILTTVASSGPMSDLMHQWQQKKGYLIFSIPVNLDPLIPTKLINAHTKLTLPLIFEQLTSVNAQQELQPVLAKSWFISSNHKSIIITLNPNHFFSDGTEVTAQDVVNSIRRLCSPSSKEYEELQSLSGCESAAKNNGLPEAYVIDKYKVKFNINGSPTTFLYQLSSPSTAITKKMEQQLIGSGPYVLKDKSYNYIVLEKNLSYADQNSVKNNGIILFHASHENLPNILVHDKPDGALMYKTHSTLTNFDFKNYRLIKTNSNITEILVINNKKFPFNNRYARKALASAIYNNISQNNLRGERKAYGIIPIGLGGSIDNKPPKLLLEISQKELFKKIPSLRKNKVVIILHELDDFKNTYITEQIIKAGKKYNIDIKFEYHNNYSTLWPLYAKHLLDGYIELYVFRNLEAYPIIRFFTTLGRNDANVNNNKIDLMLKNALSAPASHDRFQAYQKIAYYIQDEAIVIPLTYMDHDNILSKCINRESSEFYFNPFLSLPLLSKMENCNI